MNWLRTILILLLAALWAPVSVHCQLEQLPALKFLSCCSHEDAGADTHPGNGCAEDDCATDACSIVESGLYKSEDHGALVSLGDQSFTAPPSWLDFSSIPEPSFAFHRLPRNDHAPAPVRPWQFSSRAALPARAPDFAS